MSPEVNERPVNLVNVSLLLCIWLALEVLRRDSIEVNLIFELILNMYPEHFEKVLRISVFVKVSILIEIIVFQKSLTSMNLCLIVLALHEDCQQASCRLKIKELSQIALLIVLVSLRAWFVSINNLWESNTEVPNYLRRCLLVLSDLCSNHVDNQQHILSYLLWWKQLLFFSIQLFLFQKNQALGNEPQSSNRAWSDLLLVTGGAFRLFDASVDKYFNVLLSYCPVHYTIGDSS